MRQKKEVRIYGAGMSGLVAAINLAREGYRVMVYEAEDAYGGVPMYNPSAHTTPILPEKVSEYIGIDITSVFHPLVVMPSYFRETKVDVTPPSTGIYTVERGRRPSSIDSLLFPQAAQLGVQFEFNTRLRPGDLSRLQPGTIIACGMEQEIYEMLAIPYLKWHGWISHGEIGFDARSWLWWDDCITEYGYLSSINNYYTNLLFSTRPVSKQALEKYIDFMIRREGTEHADWEPTYGAVPLADPHNPQLMRKGLICCGTMAGFMDPFGWFGINGGLISGKIAALAVMDPELAHAEFTRFSKYYQRAFFIKNAIWYPYVRGRMAMLERVIRLAGPERVSKLVAYFINEERHTPYAIPGYAGLGAFYN